MAFAISYALTPLVRSLAIKLGYIDDPKRNHPAILHTKPIPRAGGVAMYIAFVVVALLMGIKDGLLISIIVAAGINVFIGTLDDKYDLSPVLRLVMQAVSALIVVIAGIQIYMTNPITGGVLLFNELPINIPILNTQISLIGGILFILWAIFLMNATNWTKGVSQLPGVAVIAFITLAAVAVKYQAGNPYQFQTAILSVIMAGAVLAFMPFNFPPEKMFPGFGMSTFVGFMLATLSVLSGGKLATLLIVYAIPVLDALYVGVKRILSGKNPLIHDKSHLYHRLLQKGLTKQKIILLYLIVAAILSIVVLVIPTITKSLLLFSLIIMILILRRAI